jgi:hypothetical protein
MFNFRSHRSFSSLRALPVLGLECITGSVSAARGVPALPARLPQAHIISNLAQN